MINRSSRPFFASLPVSLRVPLRASGLALALGATLVGFTPLPAQAQMSSKSMRSSRIGVAQAERIARNYVGRGAYVVRSEGIHNGMYRIHIHKKGVAHHVFVGARSGRVVKTMLLSVAADRREDYPRR